MVPPLARGGAPQALQLNASSLAAAGCPAECILSNRMQLSSGTQLLLCSWLPPLRLAASSTYERVPAAETKKIQVMDLHM